MQDRRLTDSPQTPDSTKTSECPRKTQLVVRRFGPCRRARGGDLHPNRHRQAQRCRSAGLARRCPRPHRGDAAKPTRRTPALELGSGTEAHSSRVEPVPAQTDLPRTHSPFKGGLRALAVFGGCILCSSTACGCRGRAEPSRDRSAVRDRPPDGKVLRYSPPPGGYRRSKPVRRPKPDSFTGFIDAILEVGKAHDVPRKWG